MEKHSHKIRVRYAECDRMGFVHHSVYALYYEEARTEILRKLGITYKEFEDMGILMPVRSMGMHFKKAALYDDLLEIEVELEMGKGVRCKFNYNIYNQNKEHLSSGYTELFFVNKSNLKPVKLPNELMAIFDENK